MLHLKDISSKTTSGIQTDGFDSTCILSLQTKHGNKGLRLPRNGQSWFLQSLLVRGGEW